MAKRQYVPIVALLAGAGLIGLLVYGLSTQSASRTLDDALARHQTPIAPEASRPLPILTGSGTASLRSYRGRVVLLNFWASWCPPCRHEAPALERVQSELVRHDATVLGVTYLDATTDSRGFIRRYGVTYPSLRDVSGEFAQAYGTQALPESFLLDRRGRIVAIERGEVKGPFLARAVTLAKST